MVEVNELDVLGGALRNLLSVVQELGNNYYRADAAWKDLPSRVGSLELLQQHLVQTLEESELDQSIAASFSVAVKHATELLNEEVAKLRRSAKRHHSWKFYACCECRECVEVNLQPAEAAYREVLENLNMQLQNNNELKKIAERQQVWLPYYGDERYVPLYDLEQKVLSALQNAGTKCVVVVVHGGPGKGKSTLARQIGLRYMQRDKSSAITKVVMLKCGQNVDVAAKQMELLQKLGGHVSQQSQGADFNVKKGLQICLRDPNVLIILDDIWEGPLMSEFVSLSSGSESGAKWLLTSQQESICQYLSSICKCVTHKIENLSQENAIKILASSAGFEDKTIPKHLHEVAADIVEKTEANPLALATLGGQIANAGPGDLEVWETVHDDLFCLLESETFVNVHGVPYPRSFMATMERSIDVLTRAQKQLLALISMCRALSVSKYALQFLSNFVISQGKGNIVTFRTSCSDLESRHLLVKDEIGSTVVSIHSLTKRYVLARMEDTVKCVENLLNAAETQAFVHIRVSVTRVLADLFIDAKFRSRALATHSATSSDLLKSNETQHNRTIMELKRNTSEPIMELLVLTARSRNQWTEELGICAQKVLLEFVNDNRLDQDSISQLLGSVCAARPILIFLKHVCLLEKPFWDSVKENPEGNYVKLNAGVPQAFLNLLRDDSCTELQERAASVLADLCWSHRKNSNTFARAPGMLSQLAHFLAQVHNSDLQKYAARVLAACSYWDYYCDGSVVQKIVAEAGLVDSLVNLLASEQNLSVQIAVGHALSNLATAKPTVKRTVSAQTALDPDLPQYRAVVSGSPRDYLARLPHLLKALTECLEVDRTESPILQERACSTLANIAGTNDIETLKLLLNLPGLVEKLVSTLNEDRSSKVQEQAARAICNLVTYREEKSPIRQELLNWPGLVEGLVESLPRSAVPTLQLNSARALSHLTYQIEKGTAHRVMSHPKLVEYLMVLSESQDTSVQTAALAVSTLCSLTDIGDDSLRARIASSPPFLAMLTKAILAGESRKFEANVVCLIANVAVTTEAGILDNITRSPGLVEKLANSLGENQNSSLQENAIRALLNLAGEENNDDFDIADFPELLKRLKQALLQSEQGVFRETVEAALASLAAPKETTAAERRMESAETRIPPI